jgi:hypothetical protein
MSRKRKQNDPATATLQELPRDTEELTTEEAEAVQGGVGPVYYGIYMAIHQWKMEQMGYRYDEEGNRIIE